MNKVLITGATGFIGFNLVKKMITLGFEIHIVVRKTSKIDELKLLDDRIYIYVYYGNIESMIKILTQSSPDLVIHLASLFIAEHSSSDVDNLMFSNLILGTHLLEAMKLTGVKYMINAGTNWQNYHGKEYNPMNLYAATKEAFEDIARYYTQSTLLRIITLKLYDTYGPNDKRQKIFYLFNKVSRTGEELNMSQGEQLLGLVYIEDIINAFLRAIDLVQTKEPHYQKVYFVNPNEFLKLKEVVKTYEKALNMKLNINWGAREYRFREIMKPYIGERLPGWKPTVNLYEGINLMIKEG